MACAKHLPVPAFAWPLQTLLSPLESLIGPMQQCRSFRPGKVDILFADAQPQNDCLVSLGIVFLEIIQQTATLADHHQKAATRGVVFLVGSEVIGELRDAFAQQRDLHFRAASVFGVAAILRNDIGLMLSG